MDDAFPPIDELARRLEELGALLPEELDEFKRLELSSISSERKEDALMLYGRLPDADPAKVAMMEGLADLRAWARLRLASASAGSPPRLLFVSGAPGSGKSAALAAWSKELPGALVASADDFKERFKQGLPAWLGETPEPARSNLGRSVYIHRLTALPSWEMVDQAIDMGRDIGVEMLGMGAAEDARTLRRALARGYRVEVIHVGCSLEQSLARAAKRFFECRRQGRQGRWIGLTQAAAKKKGILSAFAQLCELMRGSGASIKLMDNSGAAMELAWSSEQGGAPPVERFESWRPDPKLWRPGANPAADLCAFAPGEDGRWKVALIERAHEPCKGSWAFPGGFVKGACARGAFEWGPEEAKQAAVRRFAEETLAEGEVGGVELVGKFDAIERDPRNTQNRWVESWLFCGRLGSAEPLPGGDAARSAKWVDLQDALDGKVEMAFDHAKLLAEAARKAFPAPAARGPGGPKARI